MGPPQGKRMMGFPDNFILSNSMAQSMKQLGNSVWMWFIVWQKSEGVGVYGKNMKNINKKVLIGGEWK